MGASLRPVPMQNTHSSPPLCAHAGHGSGSPFRPLPTAAMPVNRPRPATDHSCAASSSSGPIALTTADPPRLFPRVLARRSEMLPTWTRDDAPPARVVSPRVPARDEARAIDVVGAIVVISPCLGFESTRHEREPLVNKKLKY